MQSKLFRSRLLICSTAMVSVMCATVTALAQDTTQQAETQLGPIVVQGQGGGIADAPASPLTQRTDRVVIQQRMVTDFKDFARRVDAGVNFNSQTNSINLRGLQNDRVLTTLDGIRVPWLVDPRSSAQGGVNSFDFDSLSAVDITKGTDSSRYGSGALGGVVELKTLNPEDLIDGKKNWGAVVKSTYDSGDESWGNNAAVAGRFNDTWLLVQGGYKKGNETGNEGTIGGYGSTRTEQNPGDFDQRNILVKLHQYLDGGHRFGLTGEIFNRDEDYSNMRGTTSSYQPGSLQSGEEVDRKRLSASYDFISPDNSDWLDQANIVGYWQKQTMNNTTDGFRLQDGRAALPAIPAIPRIGYAGTASGSALYYGLPTGVYQRDNQLEQTSYGLSGNASKAVDLGGLSNTFRFGGEIYWQDTHQYSAGVDNCPDVDWSTVPQYIVPGGTSLGPQSCRMLHSNSSDMPDVDSVTFGMYVEDDIKFLDDRLTITPGLRFDYYEHSPKNTAAYQSSPLFDTDYLEGTSDSRFSPKLRAAFKATNELELFAQWSQGFRAPSVTELYQTYGAPGSYARIGNPDLKTETSNGFEIGANYKATDYSISATVFNNYYRNFIDQVTLAPPGGDFPVGGILGYDNLNRVRIYGIELAGEWQFANNWRTWGSFAWSHGKDTDTNQYLNSVAPLRAITGLGYSTDTWGTDVSLTMASARNKTSGTGFKAPGYGLVDTTFWWQPEQIEGLKIQAGIFNIFDKKYYNAIDVPDGTALASRDFFSETGRSFRVSVTKKF
ncbi:TonB-dependent hemoglobin/transferrin/lactoferrin family receptor [Neorhizobium sp. JUb45]|uniref:TonB-dependent hemoglobin/transferrin/lactoferrin family receptor n=1 Tax=unclassified Neorhizobium TaxID=2629175 RepID=UPI001042DAC6|nr:TonB-dependent hemoglobin/transferrin/lactoferrin family receptor [Neorhizobium sp. JUb45]TCR02756.1 hemoglobin/transferrin/lactoferrin receptor protein [Neorhizobium sp. JUb45]